MQMASKREKCSMSLEIREMQTDHARRQHTPQNEWLSVRTDGPEWEATEMLLRGGWWWSHRLLAQ